METPNYAEAEAQYEENLRQRTTQKLLNMLCDSPNQEILPEGVRLCFASLYTHGSPVIKILKERGCQVDHSYQMTNYTSYEVLVPHSELGTVPPDPAESPANPPEPQQTDILNSTVSREILDVTESC